MKFSEAVRHLENIGLVVEGVGQKPHRKRPLKRNRPTHYVQANTAGGSINGREPRRVPNTGNIVPVRIVKERGMPKKLVKMIRQSRAEARDSLQ